MPDTYHVYRISIAEIIARDLTDIDPLLDPALDADLVYLLISDADFPDFDPATQKLAPNETIDAVGPPPTCITNWDVVGLDADELAAAAAAASAASIVTLKAGIAALFDGLSDENHAIVYPARMQIESALGAGKVTVANAIIDAINGASSSAYGGPGDPTTLCLASVGDLFP